jgi:DNA-binding MarR family transcriptional regulator
MIGIVKRLEARGLVVRKKSPVDMRNTLLSLTSEAQEIVELTSIEIGKRCAYFVKKLGAKTLERLNNLLKEEQLLPFT